MTDKLCLILRCFSSHVNLSKVTIAKNSFGPRKLWDTISLINKFYWRAVGFGKSPPLLFKNSKTWQEKQNNSYFTAENLGVTGCVDQIKLTFSDNSMLVDVVTIQMQIQRFHTIALLVKGQL